MKLKTNFCQCNDIFHSNNPYDEVCNMRVKADYKLCYFCYMGHTLPDRDNDPLGGEDEIGFAKGEKIDF